jgi:hypothetical protein
MMPRCASFASIFKHTPGTAFAVSHSVPDACTHWRNKPRESNTNGRLGPCKVLASRSVLSVYLDKYVFVVVDLLLLLMQCRTVFKPQQIYVACVCSKPLPSNVRQNDWSSVPSATAFITSTKTPGSLCLPWIQYDVNSRTEVLALTVLRHLGHFCLVCTASRTFTKDNLRSVFEPWHEVNKFSPKVSPT